MVVGAWSMAGVLRQLFEYYYYYYYTSQEQNLFNFTVTLHVLQPAPILIHVHLHSWLGLMTSELKGLTKKSYQGENFFLCNKFISSSINFVAMTCIIMYCRIDMHIRTERVNEEIIIQYTC